MKDTARIKIESGKGGDGIIALDRARKADGGNGGKGGDVYILGDSNIFDLEKIFQVRKFKAEDGGRGEKNKRTGKDGKDITIHVPLVTKIFNEDGTEIISISKIGEKVRLLKGGKGGFGNFSLRGDGWDGKLSRSKGEKSESKMISLELNLKADVIFLGYPNVGKSSIVNSLSNARYKVAPYEFTTIKPQLAVMDQYVLMDLPGLIEGTAKGKGLGTKFLKHTKYAKLLVHCISLENKDILKTYNEMREEFKNVSEYLYSIPELVVFTKADIYSIENLDVIQRSLRKRFKDAVFLSVYRNEDILELKRVLKKRLSSISNSTI